jgi:hypothetical protein
VAQVVEYWWSKCEALSSNSSTTKTTQKIKKKFCHPAGYTLSQKKKQLEPLRTSWNNSSLSLLRKKADN